MLSLTVTTEKQTLVVPGLLVFVTVIFNIFMRQTLNDDFLGLHKI